jgi:hypothetical protein
MAVLLAAHFWGFWILLNHDNSCIVIFNLKTMHINRRGRDRVVVEFTTICAMSAYHH